MKSVRSPFFYVGDKYKLAPQIVNRLPLQTERLIEVFAGGGSISLCTQLTGYVWNDLNEHVCAIHEWLMSYSAPQTVINDLHAIIDKYGLYSSYFNDKVDESLKRQFPKTYVAHLNRSGYMKMRSDFNASTSRDPKLLYLLVIYGFNRMIRFSRTGDFNIPVGNVDFNRNVVEALEHYVVWTNSRTIQLSRQDFSEFIKSAEFKSGDLVYFDPPYLIAGAEYNKLWDESRELDLYRLLSELDRGGIHWALSNLMEYKTQTNHVLREWASSFNVHELEANYINRFDNGRKHTGEVLVTNYD